MINKKVKIRKKNPRLHRKTELILDEIDPLNKIQFEYLSEGNYAEIYKFKIDKNAIIRNVLLKSGTYILKVYFGTIGTTDVEYFKKLSNYGLIPKIYVITTKFIVMRYIDGYPLFNYRLDAELVLRIKKLVKKWHELGFAHGDLTLNNILITDSEKIYLIDPGHYSKTGFYNDNKFLRELQNLYS